MEGRGRCVSLNTRACSPCWARSGRRPPIPTIPSNSKRWTPYAQSCRTSPTCSGSGTFPPRIHPKSYSARSHREESFDALQRVRDTRDAEYYADLPEEDQSPAYRETNAAMEVLGSEFDEAHGQVAHDQGPLRACPGRRTRRGTKKTDEWQPCGSHGCGLRRSPTVDHGRSLLSDQRLWTATVRLGSCETNYGSEGWGFESLRARLAGQSVEFRVPPGMSDPFGPLDRVGGASQHGEPVGSAGSMIGSTANVTTQCDVWAMELNVAATRS